MGYTQKINNYLRQFWWIRSCLTYRILLIKNNIIFPYILFWNWKLNDDNVLIGKKHVDSKHFHIRMFKREVFLNNHHRKMLYIFSQNFHTKSGHHRECVLITWNVLWIWLMYPFEWRAWWMLFNYVLMQFPVKKDPIQDRIYNILVKFITF